MPLATSDLEPLEPEKGRDPKAQARYLARVSGSQGETPDEVLQEWFQEQPGTAVKWAWLDLASLSWTRVSHSRDQIPGAEVFHAGASQLKRLQNNIVWERSWLWQTISKNGTWHTPPILLETAGLQGAPRPLLEPLHLAEGFHRLAAVHRAFSDDMKVADSHDFWIARLRVAPATETDTDGSANLGKP